ncbi:MAG TPA: 2-dehydropantoate 2-reductase, partial [Dehalococcoidales bacterium]|nr:2-dehydropantoate 2-reductase [Dehalococcoidales bacterium]
GAGAIGSIMGGHLFRTGHDAILIGRKGHVDAVNSNGLKLVTPTGTYELKIPAVTSPEGIQFQKGDVVCLCMKSQDTESALLDLKGASSTVPIFCFQNGVRNEETALKHYPDVYGVMVRVGAVFLKDGEVVCRRDPPGWYIIGRYPHGIDALMESVAGDLRAAGYLIKLVNDPMPYKWGKLMANLSNAIDAITGSGWGMGNDTSADFAVYQEAVDILKKAKVKWVSQEKIIEDWPETKNIRGQFKTAAQSSTWQSLARGADKLETDFLNGEIVRLAEGIGLDAPLNRKLIEITKKMAADHEKPGTYTPDQLKAMLGLK